MKSVRLRVAKSTADILPKKLPDVGDWNHSLIPVCIQNDRQAARRRRRKRGCYYVEEPMTMPTNVAFECDLV